VVKVLICILMWFIASTPVLIRHLWQLETVVFLHWCLVCAVPLFCLSCYVPSKADPLHQNKSMRSKHKQGRQAWSIDVPTLIANIFAAATNRTNILNKTGSMHHQSVYIIRCHHADMKLLFPKLLKARPFLHKKETIFV
jgi:hypothetical protein